MSRDIGQNYARARKLCHFWFLWIYFEFRISHFEFLAALRRDFTFVI